MTAEIQQVVTATQQNVQDAASSIADVKDEMASLCASVSSMTRKQQRESKKQAELQKNMDAASAAIIAKEQVEYDSSKVLGQGSYAKVYEGMLDGETKIAAKVFDLKSVNLRDQTSLYASVYTV